jgi:3-phosphoshikimate 1-carboxyvinyltransferase
LLAGQSFFSVLTGDDSIRKRPMGRVVGPLRQMGATIAGRCGGELAPLAITGSRLTGIAYRSPIASAQVKSSVLLAGLFAEGVTSVTEPALSRDHTERMFAFFGIPVTRNGFTVSIAGRPSYAAKDVAIPGDLSAAAFYLVAASLVPDSDLTITDVGINPTRTGILDILRDMGARIDMLNVREQAGEPICDLRVRAAPLHGITIDGASVLKAIDEIPILAVAAAAAVGNTTFTGAAEWRVKESDRLATMAAELGRMGVRVEERPDGLRITGGRALKGAVCESHGDHRVAMSMAIAGLIAEGETTVKDTACVATSFPDFSKYLMGLLTR